MKIAICCLNSKYIHASLAPWCLFSALKEKHPIADATVLESTINNDTSYLIDKITDGGYNVVSFSCYIWNITKTLDICKAVKDQTDATIVLGGPEVSYRAKSILSDYPFIDFVLSGEGEETFPELINAICNNTDHKCINGLSYRHNNTLISNPEVEYNGTPVNPYCEKFLDNIDGRISYIEASRGCPYRCAFCLSGRCSTLRYFNFEQTKGKIITLANCGSKTIKFIDRTFNANAQKSDEILQFILDNYGINIPKNVCFHFEIAGDILKESTLNIFKNAPKGLFQLEIGMQTFNEKTLSAINRKTNCEKLIENIKKLISLGNMHIHIDLIAGLPYEDIQSFERSFDTGYALGANMLQMGFLKLLHGADMREEPDKYPCKFSSEPPYEVISTSWLSEGEIKKLKKCEDALDRLYNNGRFLFTLDYLLNECGYTPFRLFYEFGNTVIADKTGLSDYTKMVFDYFKDKADSERLREALICDLLSCSSALQIPDFLKRADPQYKQIKKHFVDGCSDKIKIAILYKSNKVFAVNQSKPKGFDERYKGTFYSLDDFKNIINKND